MKTTCTLILMLFFMAGLEMTMAQPVKLGAARDFLILQSDESAEAGSDLEAAYKDAAERDADYVDLYSGDIGGKRLKPGVYEWNSDVVINADVYLEGGPDVYWIFNINGSLSIAPGVHVIFENCSQPENVFWTVSGDVTIGENAYFAGIVLAQGAVILEDGAYVNGRVLSQKSVTLDQDQVRLDQFTELLITKTAEPQTYYYVGQEIYYTIYLYNSGTLAILDIHVNDPLADFYRFIQRLNPCHPMTFVVKYTITQDDLDNGFILNTVTAIGVDTELEAVEESAEELITAIQNPELSLVKTADKDTVSLLNETISYTITVANPGNITLFDITVDDPKTGFQETIAKLSPGDEETYTVNYQVTQEDLDAGSVHNIATAIGAGPQEQIAEAEDEVLITATQNAEINLEKTVNTQTFDTPGEVITYTIEVSNAGNVTLSDVVIEDPFTSLVATISSLNPGVSQTITTTYTITQEDLDAGSIINVATVIATDPNGEDVTATDEATITAIQSPQISMHKTADTETYEMPGAIITYSLEISNTGNVTLTEALVEDPLTGLSEIITSLGPGAARTFTTTYTITQEDLDSGSVMNAATVTASDPEGEDVTAGDEESITATKLPQISLQKTTDTETYEMPGELITYTIKISNTGNVILTEVMVEDPLTGLSEIITSLSPGASLIFTTTYTITQEDLDNGSVINAATVNANDPEGEDVTADDEETVTAIQNAQISLQKTANSETYDGVGVQITYTITIENTGNVSVTDINIEDDLTGDSWELAALTPGEDRVFSTQYTTTQQDFDHGSITNTASAIGKDPQGNDVTASDEELVTSTSRMAELSVTKTADRQTYENPGDIITYTIEVSNTGNLTITDISIVDDLTGNSWSLETLSPGESESFIATHTITSNDIDVGSVINTVVATGQDPQGQPIEGHDQETVTATKDPMLSITKTATPLTYSQVGAQIAYVITVENTGNVTIIDIVVEDDLTGDIWQLASFEPGAQETFTTSYTITQEDLNRGSVVNIATATGKDPDGNSIAGSDDATVTAINVIPTLTVSKSSPRPVYASVGDVIHYEIVVTNTGNTSLYNVNIEDNLTRESWSITLLNPNESQTFNTSYTVTQYDIDVGTVHNIATAFAEDFQGNTVSDSDEETAIAIKVPGGLTPDIEFDNILIIKGLEYYPRNTFRIFNRYGTLVFEASPYQNDWVGVPNRGLILTEADGKVPSGTYFYMLELEPGQKPFSGYIYLIKN